jgi:predicted amidophosphoribosyltransferase
LALINAKEWLNILKNNLIKIKENLSQAHTKSKNDRLKNIIKSFKVCEVKKIEGKNIILIDDVWTTGATINEARKELLKAGAKNVIAYTIAH